MTEIFLCQAQYVIRCRCPDLANTLGYGLVVLAAKDVLDRDIGNAERPVQYTHDLADHEARGLVRDDVVGKERFPLGQIFNDEFSSNESVKYLDVFELVVVKAK